MTELQPPDAAVNGGILDVAAPPPPPPPPPSADIPNLTTKRQRRPSVRLGEIGDHKPSSLSYEPYKRPTTTTTTTNRLWSSDSKFHHNQYSPSTTTTTTTTTTTGTAGIKSSKTRTLTNFSNGVNIQETLQTEEKKNSSKAKRGGTKRVRSNWVPKIDQGAATAKEEIAEKFSEDEDWYKGFDDVVDDSDPSPDQSREDNVLLHRSIPRGTDQGGAVELDTNLKDWNCRTSVDGNNGVSEDRGKEMEGLEDGVRMWLNGLGLRRYEPVFEVHEVDEEVLPLLTLDDLKDMGINAVGSRRKLYCAIQKLGKGFS